MTLHEDLLKAMKFARAGEWHAAHEIVQSRSDKPACRIHAWLHRVEGDDGNAAYWYNRADTGFPSVSVNEEAEQIVDDLKQDHEPE